MFIRKKRMTEKIMHISRVTNETPGQKLFMPYGFVFNYSNRCNFKCKHCYTGSGSGDIESVQAEKDKGVLSLGDIKSLADQADDLGVYEIDIQGGEPLLFPNLFDILDALGIDRYYTYITTNGWLLTQALADKLAEAGVDRMSVSIDAFSAAEHDWFRRKAGSYDRAIKALEYTKNAGMKPYVNTVIGSYNARTKGFEEFCEYVLNMGYGLALNCATPTGAWKGKYDVMLTPDDTKHIESIRGNNKEIIRDLWNYFNLKDSLVKGCPAVNLFYVNPFGDILACPYIHTSFGNIKKKPLKEILDFGFSFEIIRKYSPLCLAGEDAEFAKKYLSQETSILHPMPAAEYFREDQA
jgi:MoaA/NifB/PqqE/SkfB family radical SAM enzyme